MGFAYEQDDPDDPAKQSQRVVSFSETPLEHTQSMCVEIEDREGGSTSSRTASR
jgi:hypothetical protein